MIPELNKSYRLESKTYKGIGKFIEEGVARMPNSQGIRYIFQLAETGYGLFTEDEIKKELISDIGYL